MNYKLPLDTQIIHGVNRLNWLQSPVFDKFSIVKPEIKVQTKPQIDKPIVKVSKLKPPVIVSNDDPEPIDAPEPAEDPTETTT